MVLEIPDQLLSGASYSAEKFKLDVAVMLYQKEVMSLARAAEWLGISRIAFQKVLHQSGTYLHYEISDLQEEMANFDKMGL